MTGFHPLDGGRFVRGNGHERLACLVAQHSGTVGSSSAWDRRLLRRVPVRTGRSTMR